MTLTTTLLLLFPAIGQADSAPTRYVPKEGDFRYSLDEPTIMDAATQDVVLILRRR